MSARRVLIGSAIALLMPASLLLSTTPSSATDGDAASASAESSPVLARKKKKKRVPLPTTTPTFADEFSGTTLGPAWNHRGTNYEPKSKRRCSKADPKAVKVKGGAVHLSVMKDKSRKGKCKARKGNKTYKVAYRLNGHIGTQGTYSFRYGTAAARIKMHKARGQHSSFWMQPEPGTGDGNEIDVIEYFGDKHPQGGLTSFIHWNKGKKAIKTGSWIKNSTKYLKNKKDGWSKKYHVFSVEWTPQVLIFRIDGKETWRTKVKVSTAKQYPILSLLASDYEMPLMKDSKLPQKMSVDWVRIWETAPEVAPPPA